MDDLNIQAGVTVNAEQAERAFDNLANQAQQMADRVTKAADKAGQATDGMGNGAEKSAEKFTRAESRISASIKRATNELELLGKTASQRLEFNISDKGLDAAKFEPALKKLRELEAQAQQAQRAASGSLDKMGISAAQTAAALRGVPAQFTDIVTSLQGGQAPLTVFLQQGGQLKDMFGGAGNAARALGGYVLGLVNPFTIAAAAVAGIAVAYNQGAKEADAYRAALVTTGNAAGTNAAQLKSYAQEISSVVGTQGKAAEALSALAATGKVGAENLREAAQAAVAYERATGQAASKTAEQFASLRNEPLSAVLKLNEGMNFLTDSTYKQIKSLEEQGKTAEAANVAQRAFADTLSGRAGEMERNLGAVERGWIAVKDAAKSAWDAILNVGRASTSVDQLAEVRKQIAQRENQIANGGFGANEGGAAFGRPSQAATERLRAELAGLQAKAAALEGVSYATKVSADEERKRGEAVKAGAAFDKAGEKFLSDKTRMERELAAARVQGAEAGRSQEEIEKRLGEIRASYAKKGGVGVAAENKYLRDQQRIFAELAGVSSTYYAELANAQKQRAAGVITEQQYVTAVQSLIEKQPFAVALAKEEAAATQALSKSYAEAAAERLKTIQSMERAADSLQSQNDALREEIELIGLSTEQQTLVLQQRNDVIILTKEATLAELERQSAITGTQTRVEIALASEIEALKERNALLGAKGVKNAAVDAAKSAADEWQKTSDKINDTLTDALMRGFESGKDFAKNLRDTVVNMFKTMVLRPVISAIVNPVAGAVTGMMGLSGAANASTGGASMVGNVGSLLGAGSSAFGIGASYGATSLFANGLGSTLSAGSSMIGAGSTMSGLGTIAGALAPISLGIGAIYAIAKSLDDSGTYHTGGAAQYSAAGGLLSGQSGANYNIGFGRVEAGADSIKAVGGIAQALGTALDGVAVSFGQKAGYEIATAFADDTSKDGAWGALRISKEGKDLLNWEQPRQSRWAPKEFADGESGYKEYLAAVAKDTRQVLLDMDLPSWADTIITSIGDAANMDQLSAAVQQIGAIQTAFVNLGKSIEGFAGMSDKAFEALMKASGGLEALSANAGSYYENFYSDAEKTAAVTRSVSDALAAVGLEMPATRDKFRALVESQLALGEEGAKASATLLGVSGAFASVVPAAEQAAEAISQIMQNLLRDRAGLEADLLRAQGNTAGADAANRMIDIAGYTEAETALYDYNAALRAQIEALEKSAEASRIAVQAERDLIAARAQSAQDAYGTAQAATNAAMQALERSVGAQRTIYESARSAATDAAQEIKSVIDTIAGSIKDLYGEVDSTMRQSAAAGMDFVANALQNASATGYLPDSKDLSEAIAAARTGMGSENYASQFEADRARLVLAGQLSDLGEFAKPQLTAAERAVQAAEEQLKALEGVLSNARDQVDAARGIDTTLKTIPEALASLQTALVTELQAQTQAFLTGIVSSLSSGQIKPQDAIKSYEGKAGEVIPREQWVDLAGTQSWISTGGATALGGTPTNAMDAVIHGKGGDQFTVRTAVDFVHEAMRTGDLRSIYDAAVLHGISSVALDAMMGWTQGTALDWAKSQGLPAFAVGTNYVPRDMAAIVHEGEAIVPKAYNPAASGQGGQSSAKLEALVSQLIDDNRRQAGEIIRLNNKMTKVLEQWNGDGMPTTREEATV